MENKNQNLTLPTENEPNRLARFLYFFYLYGLITKPKPNANLKDDIQWLLHQFYFFRIIQVPRVLFEITVGEKLISVGRDAKTVSRAIRKADDVAAKAFDEQKILGTFEDGFKFINIVYYTASAMDEAATSNRDLWTQLEDVLKDPRKFFAKENQGLRSVLNDFSKAVSWILILAITTGALPITGPAAIIIVSVLTTLMCLVAAIKSSWYFWDTLVEKRAMNARWNMIDDHQMDAFVETMGETLDWVDKRSPTPGDTQSATLRIKLQKLNEEYETYKWLSYQQLLENNKEKLTRYLALREELVALKAEILTAMNSVNINIPEIKEFLEKEKNILYEKLQKEGSACEENNLKIKNLNNSNHEGNSEQLKKCLTDRTHKEEKYAKLHARLNDDIIYTAASTVFTLATICSIIMLTMVAPKWLIVLTSVLFLIAALLLALMLIKSLVPAVIKRLDTEEEAVKQEQERRQINDSPQKKEAQLQQTDNDERNSITPENTNNKETTPKPETKSSGYFSKFWKKTSVKDDDLLPMSQTNNKPKTSYFASIFGRRH